MHLRVPPESQSVCRRSCTPVDALGACAEVLESDLLDTLVVELLNVVVCASIFQLAVQLLVERIGVRSGGHDGAARSEEELSVEAH